MHQALQESEFGVLRLSPLNGYEWIKTMATFGVVHKLPCSPDIEAVATEAAVRISDVCKVQRSATTLR